MTFYFILTLLYHLPKNNFILFKHFYITYLKITLFYFNDILFYLSTFISLT